LRCDKCGYEGAKVEFRYQGLASGIGAATMRRCPQCGKAVYCDETTEEEGEVRPWGVGKVWGQTCQGKKEEEE
jgi:hypothetical protein